MDPYLQIPLQVSAGVALKLLKQTSGKVTGA